VGKNGDYLLASRHCIRPDVPPENVKALFSAQRSLSRI
jgi:uroporphyrinogen-III decarboxylase